MNPTREQLFVTASMNNQPVRLEAELLRVSDSSKSRGTIVLLHEGLGCVELWKSFPQELAEETSYDVVSYSRAGHGRSDQPSQPRDIGYLHHEANQVLPQILTHFRLSNPVLLGHSDGASIALLYASRSDSIAQAIIVEAPHLFVETITLAGIRQAGDKLESGLEKRLSRYHNNARALFLAWYETWLRPEFEQWNIEESIRAIRCPILAIQGEGDQYGTLRQIEQIQALAPQTELFKVPECGHSPHQEHPRLILQRLVEFLSPVL